MTLQPHQVFDLGVGTYDVTISIGPSYQSKRQEAVASMMALIQAFPEVFPVIGDLLTRNFDWPMANEIADRLKRQLPPNLQDDAPEGDKDAQLAKSQAQLQQIFQQHDLLVKQLNGLIQERDTKQQQLDQEFRLAKMKAEFDMQTKISVAEITSKAQAASIRAQFELKGLQMSADLEQSIHDSSHEAAMSVMQNGHESAMANSAAVLPQQAQPAQLGAQQ